MMARIQISNDPSGRIIVSFPYDPLLISKIKTIEGRRWHLVEKHWSFPKLDGMLKKILKVFGDEGFQIDPDLEADLPKTFLGGSSWVTPIEKTSEIYPHVSTKSLGKIMNPLVTLELAKGGDE